MNVPNLKKEEEKRSLIKVIRGEATDNIPIWLMRQAGRYLPEYREIRKNAGTFLDLCYNPELATEVTMQPIRRFGFDASIIFSDILVIPHAMGVGLEYKEGEGPVLEKIDSADKINNLIMGNVREHLNPVFEALKNVRGELSEDKTLIGFAGAPWTVATYMVEGGSSKNYHKIKELAFKNPDLFKLLLDKLVTETSEYLIAQIEAGADVIKIFDSWAGVLAEKQFEDFVLAPTAQIVRNVRAVYPDVPIIGLPKGAGVLYEKYADYTGVDVIAFDYMLPAYWAKDVLQQYATVQGNLDPNLLASDINATVNEVKRLKSMFNDGKYIFNLGHGILPHTPIENVEILVDTIRG